ncbi:MAG: hypothetical protein ACJ75F_07700 [Flavisolibacter sp.]
MIDHTLILPESWINYLANLPESGMGYQLVRIILKGGKTLSNHKVINSSLLLLEENENFEVGDIEQIELEL